MRRGHIINSPKLLQLRRKRRNALWGKIVIFSIIILAACAGTVYVSRAAIFNIQKIEVVGNKIADSDLIEQVARDEMAAAYLGLFPKTNILIYPEEEVKNSLNKEFRRLTDIELNLNSGRTLEIKVAERVGVYTWCGLVPLADEKCYFVDKEGFIFEEAPYFSEEVYFKFYGGDFENNESALGQYFTREHFNDLVLLADLLKNVGVDAVAIQLEDEQDGKIILSSKNIRKDNPIINFKIDSNFEEVVQNLQTALETEPFKGDFKKKYAKLEYIDLRFGNKVYYKFSD